MADVIRWIDGFDHLTSSQYTRKGYTGNPSNNNTGRFADGCMELTGATDVGITLGSSFQAWRIGFAFKLDTHNGSALQLLQLFDAGTIQVELGYSATRQLRITRNGNQLGVSTKVMTLGIWYYWEWYVVISNSITAGHCSVRVDGVEWLTLAGGTDTQNTANASANKFTFVGTGSNNLKIDDLVVSTMDVTTTPTFLGDCRVATLQVNGNGNYSQFNGSDGNSTDNYLLVDESTPNDDTDYVQEDTVSDKDSYALENLPSTPSSVKAVQISSTAKKDDAGSRTARLFFRISGTDYESADLTPSTSYTTLVHGPLETSPASSSAWTEAEINAMEAGIKVQA